MYARSLFLYSALWLFWLELFVLTYFPVIFGFLLGLDFVILDNVAWFPVTGGWSYIIIHLIKNARRCV